ncbi:MAG: DUF1858 domain-containing protein [Acidobacteriota bacterium]
MRATARRRAVLASTTVEELLVQRPGARAVFLRHGMACIGCTMAPFDTLADAAKAYRLPLATLLGEVSRTRTKEPRR